MQRIPQAELQEELLKQLAEQVKRSAVPVGLSMALIAYMASQHVSVWFWGIWLALVIATQGLRFYVFRQLPGEKHIPVEKRMHTAFVINLGGTILHSVSLVWFPLFSPYEGAVQSMLFIGMGVGSVMMFAGYPPWARTHVFYSLVPMFSMWAWSGLFADGGNTALFLALIGTGYCATIFKIADHIFGLYRRSFETGVQLKTALANAEAAGRAKTRFLATASHDLRQPIHALVLFSAALVSRKLDEGTSQIVEKMDACIEALTHELDGLLDISKLDAGIITASRTNFCLASLVRRLLGEFSSQAERRNIELILDCPDRAVVYTDGALLERILRNLVSNAILHNDQCELILRLVPAGSNWQIAVADTGRGIDPLEQEKIFEEFYQLENLERDRSKGLGLGLSIVRRLSDLLDIKMEFESEPGKGTQFSFTIAASEQEEIDESTVDFTHDSLESLVILVVDDELSVREGMRAILERLGCKVVTADSSDAAIAAATTEKPDIALVDFRLREHDSGLLAIDRLRHLYPELPAIIISGETAPDRLVEVSRTNIPVLAKPVLIGPLKEAILRKCFPRSESSQNVAE